MDTCAHQWQPDPESQQFEECGFCGAVRRVMDYCSHCGGRGWYLTDHIDEEGYTKKIREPCPVCGGLRLVRCAPKML